MLIRFESIGDYREFSNPFASLVAWERRFLQDIYLAGSSSTSAHQFDAAALLRTLHSVVLALFCLQDPYFYGTYNSHRSQQGGLTPTSGGGLVGGFSSPSQLTATQGYDHNFATANHSYLPHQNNFVLSSLLDTLKLHMTNQLLFSRWGYLLRFAEICVLALLRLPVQPEDDVSNPNHPQFGFVFDDRHQVLQDWRALSLVSEERWAHIVVLIERDAGWSTVLELNDEFVEYTGESDSDDEIGSANTATRK